MKKMKAPAAIACFGALAHESRLSVFRLLVRSGPAGLAATRIADKLALPPSSLSFHLKELTQADLVIQTRAGRSLIYSVNSPAVNGLLTFLTEDCCGGNPCSPVDVRCTTTEKVALR